MPYYVYKDEDILVRCNYKPSMEDLATRGEKAVELSDDITDIMSYKIVNGIAVKKDSAPQESVHVHDDSTHKHNESGNILLNEKGCMEGFLCGGIISLAIFAVVKIFQRAKQKKTC